MSWSKSYMSRQEWQDGGKRNADRASLGNEREQAQYDAAVLSADNLIGQLVVAGRTEDFSVSVAGHANADRPTSNDSISISLSRK
jgi:hypothetical protein